MERANLHIIHNGEIIQANSPVFTAANRAFSYGDAIFESLHASGSEIQFANDHFERLFKGIDALKIQVDFSQIKLLKEIHRLLNRDKLFGGVRIKIIVYRDAEGFFKPQNEKSGYVITCLPLENQHYYLNQKGLQIGVYKEIKKPINFLSAFKTSSSLLNVMAGIYCNEQQWDDCLIVNEQNAIIESYHSNLFLVKKNVLFTPPLVQGCIDGIMRKQIIKIASLVNLKISEQIVISEELLPEADEIFLCNAIEGIRWVLAYKNRRYFNRTSKILSDKLNEIFIK